MSGGQVFSGGILALLAIGLPISLATGVAQPRCRRAARHEVGRATGPAPANTAAAVTASVTTASTHGRVGRAGSVSATSTPDAVTSATTTSAVTASRRGGRPPSRWRTASAPPAARDAQGPATRSAPPSATSVTTAGRGTASGSRDAGARAPRPVGHEQGEGHEERENEAHAEGPSVRAVGSEAHLHRAGRPFRHDEALPETVDDDRRQHLSLERGLPAVVVVHGQREQALRTTADRARQVRRGPRRQVERRGRRCGERAWA